jgi:protein-S-isoprenylcysteine O-methyltransferase Ste14
MTPREAARVEQLPTASVSSRRRFKWRGAAGVVLLTPAVVATVLADPLVRPHSWLDLTIDAVAWAVFVAGAGLRFWATLHIGGRKSDFVVSEGPYSLCRHPLYFGSILLVLSGALFLKSLLFAGALALLATAYFRLTIPVEEEFLLARLGEPYRQYSQRVNRLWPSFRHFHTPSRMTVDVHSLYVECARASRWLWLPLLGELVGRVRDANWWPHLFRVP